MKCSAWFQFTSYGATWIREKVTTDAAMANGMHQGREKPDGKYQDSKQNRSKTRLNNTVRKNKSEFSKVA